jgi:DNA polymerase III gamma/tau subunit
MNVNPVLLRSLSVLLSYGQSYICGSFEKLNAKESMRLGQLARKLDVRPNEIIEFLAKHNISVDNSSNARVEADLVALTIQHFSPTAPLNDTLDQGQLTDAAHEEVNTTISQPTESDAPLETTSNETVIEQNEVIKAPKVELSGLKVLGKIDLSQDKKKEPDKSMPEESAAPKEPKKEKRNHAVKRHQRPTKNPIALQREQEAVEAKKKREEENRLQKEKRTQNYLRKVKAHQPTKAARVIREETEELSAAELEEPPKTWWGKFVKWLTR